MMKIGVIILSRMDSSRLPGKALIDIAGRPLIGHVLSFCQKIDGIDSIALATSNRLVDAPLSEFAKINGIACIRGSLDNVAERFLSTMIALDLDVAVRVNGDSPLNDPNLISEGIRRFKQGSFDLVSNVPKRTYPFGVSVEIIGRNAMEYACSVMNDQQHREHVTKYFYDHKEKFKIFTMTSGEPAFAGVQLAVDTREDLDRINWIISQLECEPADADITTLVRLAQASPSNGESKHD